MPVSSEKAEQRRQLNRTALMAFSPSTQNATKHPSWHVVQDGNGPAVFTIGYERRDLEDLVSRLLEAGVETLVDVRHRPMSRRSEFRRRSIESACEACGIDYQSWPDLGSTDAQRDGLRETSNFREFRRRFRDMMKRSRSDSVARLASLASDRVIALLCYERQHCECHRSVLCELLHELTDTRVVAIR